MFGLEYRTLLLKDIIEILDISEEALSVEEIRKRLGYSNSVTILKSLKELIEFINQIDGQDKFSVELTNPKRGYFKLKRFSTNLQSLFELVFSQDIAYDILLELIEKRVVYKVNFCLTHNISAATLYRKIQQINQEVAAYNIQISYGNEIKFKAEELNIRIFSYVFIWSTSRQFPNIFGSNTKPNMNFFAEEVLKYLNIPYSSLQIELLSIWIFIYSNAISRKKELSLTEEQFDIIQAFTLPKKPEFFSQWSNLDWNMLLVTMYNSDLYDIYLPLSINIESNTLKKMVKSQKLFLMILESYFSVLNNYDKEKLSENWAKYYLAYYFTNYDSEPSKNTTHILNMETFQSAYPNYWKRFENFWLEFIQQVDDPHHYDAMKVPCLLMIIRFYPIEKFGFPPSEISLFLSTDTSLSFSEFLKQAIYLRFRDQYMIQFVSEVSDAEIIVATNPFDKNQIRVDQEFLVVSSQMREVDFNSLKELFEKLQM